MKTLRAGIIGVSGYTGADLLKILHKHPHFTISYVANTQGGVNLGEIHREFYNVLDLPVQKASVQDVYAQCDVVFLALPHKSAMEFVKALRDYGGLDSNDRDSHKLKIIDLSADYRLSAEHYEAVYCPHIDYEGLSHAVYGLPEYAHSAIANASLVANPGCYPTATLLALLPFLPYVEGEIFVDAKSGVSGAGKKLTDDTHYPNINENIFSYAPLTHRHQIEIEEKCAQFGAMSARVHFVPHLCPFTRGMLVSVFATLKSEYAEIEPLEVLQRAYANAPFVRICHQSVRVSNVRGSNMCDIFALKRGRALYVSSAIDNLMRGASSQAVVNANIMCGFAPESGIPQVGW